MTADQHSWQQAVEWLNLNNQSQFEQNEGRSLKSTLQKSRPVLTILQSQWKMPHPLILLVPPLQPPQVTKSISMASFPSTETTDI